jgi:hypothetical protein
MKETGELSSQDAAEIAEEVHDMKKKGQKINAERIIRNLRKCGISGKHSHNRWECPHYKKEEATLAKMMAESHKYPGLSDIIRARGGSLSYR